MLLPELDSAFLKLAASVHKEHVTHTVFSFKNILDDKAKEEKIII